jgi:hypothetical protein
MRALENARPSRAWTTTGVRGIRVEKAQLNAAHHRGRPALTPDYALRASDVDP